MVKGDLIFDWDTKDFHRGRKIASVLLVVAVSFVCFLVMKVKLSLAPELMTKSASMIKVGDDDFGRVWQMRAEEEGPFPGGLDTMAGEDGFELLEGDVFGGNRDWGSYESSPRELAEIKEVLSEAYAQKGRRYFPDRVDRVETLVKNGVVEVGAVSDERVPVLIPFNEEALGWLPEELPEYKVSASGVERFSLLRFVLSLRSDGSVEHCVALGGEELEVVPHTLEWLQGVRFQPSDEEERWFGLRLELENIVNDGD